jgi:hypothetical protein
MTDQTGSGSHARPLTYDDAESVYRGSLLTAGRERYDELTDRDLSASTAARLRERGEVDPGNPGHQAIAAKQPLSADEYLERMAIGEALARYCRHPAMLDDAAKAGASWERVGAARGTSADQARQDYREWADGQHHLPTWTEGRFGMSGAEYAEAIARTAEPEPGAANAYAADRPVLCAHADQDGRGSHWLEPGETCAGLRQATAIADMETRAVSENADYAQALARHVKAALLHLRQVERLAELAGIDIDASEHQVPEAGLLRAAGDATQDLDLWTSGNAHARGASRAGTYRHTELWCHAEGGSLPAGSWPPNPSPGALTPGRPGPYCVRS